MKTTYIIISFIAAGLLISMPSCNDITDQNVSPNSPQEVSSGFVLTYVLTEFSKTYNRLGEDAENISGAMQYTQRGTDFNALRVNSYDWSNESWSYYYHLLRNVDIINSTAIQDEHPFYEGVSLVLRALIFGTITDLYGDAPYSESLHANEGIYFPVYDEQKTIYKGILEDLKTADARLASVNLEQTPIPESADVIYHGDPDKWRRFANSLRLRYCLRLYNKRDEMNAIGVNIISEFNAASTFVFGTIDDNAILEFLGVSPNNSAPGGPLNSANPGYSNKPCQTLVGKLLSLNDPRLYRWVRPVLRKWDVNVTEETERVVTNIFGESQTVIYTPTSTPDQVDTSLYVGLPPGLAGNIALDYNKGNDTNEYPSEENPFVSFISTHYMENANPFVNIRLMTLSEVEFILAQAALYGDFGVSGSTEDHYINGIKASFDDYLVDEAIGGFDFDSYYNNPDVKLADAPDKLERILEQKWISHWWGIESWFDWRRTGLPDLQAGPVALFGDKLPLRFIYPAPNQDPAYLENYNEAVGRLEKTPNVPTGQTSDHNYSRFSLNPMEPIQGKAL